MHKINYKIWNKFKKEYMHKQYYTFCIHSAAAAAAGAAVQVSSQTLCCYKINTKPLEKLVAVIGFPF